MNIHHRLKKIIEDENISISKFERIIGAGKNSVSTCLRRESSINHIVLQGIYKNFPHISIEWILTGRDSKNKQVIEKINALLEEIRTDLKNISG